MDHGTLRPRKWRKQEQIADDLQAPDQCKDEEALRGQEDSFKGLDAKSCPQILGQLAIFATTREAICDSLSN